MSELELSKELKDAIKSFIDLLDENGWELNDEGDIVDKKSKRLIMEIYNGCDNYE